MTEPAERLLITGANGHLGRRLMHEIVAAGGPRPRAVVRSERAAGVLRALPESERPEIEIVDYADSDGLARALEGCRDVVHLVGILKEAPGTSYQAAHERATGALLRAAEKTGARRIVYLSILGAAPDSPNACLASKGRAERMLLEGSVPACVLRVPMVLGPGDFASRALRGQALAPVLPLVRGGATLEQPIDARDVVAAIRGALRSPDAAGEAFELGGPECLSHRELVMRAAALYERTPRVLPLPLALARLGVRLAERLLASPPVTLAMLEVLEHDDRVDAAPACARLGVTLTPLDETLRRYVGPGAPSS